MQGRYPPNVPQMNESYTVLPVGHGNFLKVYHSNENDAPTFNSYELFSSSSFIPPHTVRPPPTNNIQMQTAAPSNENTTNMIINQLVTSWTPNTSGTYSPFGEQQPPPLNIFDSATNKENINTEIINLQKLANEGIGSVLNNKTRSPKWNQCGCLTRMCYARMFLLARIQQMEMEIQIIWRRKRQITSKTANIQKIISTDLSIV